jgi:HSP20 family protein
MVNISNWLPFKFRRRTADEKKSESRGSSVPVTVQGSGAGTSPAHPESPESVIQRMWKEMTDDRWLEDPLARLGSIDRWFGDFSPQRFYPSVDVTEEAGALCVSVELPGMERDHIELSIDRNVLTIEGEKKNENESKEEGVYRTERYYGYFQRSVPLPEGVDQQSAEASFKNGVLRVRFRMKPEAKDQTRRIPIGD